MLGILHRYIFIFIDWYQCVLNISSRWEKFSSPFYTHTQSDVDYSLLITLLLFLFPNPKILQAVYYFTLRFSNRLCVSFLLFIFSFFFLFYLPSSTFWFCAVCICNICCKCAVLFPFYFSFFIWIYFFSSHSYSFLVLMITVIAFWQHLCNGLKANRRHKKH